MTVDLNADVGEGSGSDGDLIPLVTSVNVACGAHAGDVSTMRAAIVLALRHGVAVGAHPGFADRENFGRKELSINPAAAAGLVLGQTRMLRDVATPLGATVGHVKLHGALYNMAAGDRALAQAVVAALVGDTAQKWTLVALAGSVLVSVAREQGLRVVGEAFADRTYRLDGSLTPRTQRGAVIEDPEAASRQALRIAMEGTVRCADGADIKIDAGTICLHGDGAAAVEFAGRIRRDMTMAGVTLAHF